MTEKGKYMVSGALAGALNGFFGAGGGMLLVPLFTSWVGMETAQAFPAALFVLLPATLVSLGVYLFTGRLEAAGLLPYLLGGAAGGVLCGLIYDKLPQRLLRILFGALLIFGGIRAVMG